MKIIKEIYVAAFLSVSVFSYAQDTKMINRGFNLSGRSEESTAAVSTIYMDDSKTSDINPANSLYGKLPGLFSLQGSTVAWDNDPTMYVRGLATMGAGTPLVLIDGFERPLSSLSQDEIESVTVLKDAASQALYGVRGANGVILVTTKRGILEGMKVHASYQFGINLSLIHI